MLQTLPLPASLQVTVCVQREFRLHFCMSSCEKPVYTQELKLSFSSKTSFRVKSTQSHDTHCIFSHLQTHSCNRIKASGLGELQTLAKMHICSYYPACETESLKIYSIIIFKASQNCVRYYVSTGCVRTKLLFSSMSHHGLAFHAFVSITIYNNYYVNASCVVIHIMVTQN